MSKCEGVLEWHYACPIFTLKSASLKNNERPLIFSHASTCDKSTTVSAQRLACVLVTLTAPRGGAGQDGNCRSRES
jgi:hypothetical protein